MKFLIKFICCFLLLFSVTAKSQIANSNTVVRTFNASSYDVGNHCWGEILLGYFPAMDPTKTNYFMPWSRAGSSWLGDIFNQEERYCLPFWAGAGTSQIVNYVGANDNGSITDTNTTFSWGTNMANAPSLFYNGTAYTNEGYASLQAQVKHIFLGENPHDSVNGDGGSVSRQIACNWLNQSNGNSIVDIWDADWTNGWNTDITGARILGYEFGSHPHAAGFLANSIYALTQLGAETNVGSFILDVNSLTATTNHCFISNVQKSGAVTSFTIHFDRMPFGWPTYNGTNDGNQAFIAIPSLANAFRWTFQTTNLPPGNYALYVDGVLINSGNNTLFNSGINQFTNTVVNNPLWLQRLAVFNGFLDLYGLNHTNFTQTHTAGSFGVIAGAGDLINYQSQASGFYNTSGHRGSQYVSDMATPVSDLKKYSAAIYTAAQQTNHSIVISNLNITMLSAPILYSGKVKFTP